MNERLQFILIISSIIFLAFIVFMVRNKKIELKYTLIWLFTGVSFIILSIFPGILKFISFVIQIKEPVNTLFLLIIFFNLMIIFSLTLALSRSSKRLQALAQELGILGNELEKLKAEKSGSTAQNRQ